MNFHVDGMRPESDQIFVFGRTLLVSMVLVRPLWP